MPRSTNYFKDQTKDYILENYDKSIRILDVGPGIGTYYNILSLLGYHNIDCVEAFEPYVQDYGLEKKYKNVFIGNVCELDIDFNSYDLVILGDVLEHISKSDAQKLLSKIQSNCIVAIPFLSPQEESFGNKYEIHLQDDLTPDLFTERYEGFYPLCLRFDYGVYVKETSGYVFIEEGEIELPTNYRQYLSLKFPTLKLEQVTYGQEIIGIKENKTTIVTALYDLGRDNISDSFKRKYDDYLKKFSDLLKTDIPMYIFIDESDEEFIWQHRKKENTVINKMSLDELKKWFEFTNITNRLRKDENWLSQASWLRESPQATLEGYNPLVMSKMFMLNNVTIWNPFGSENFFWIDAGITNTVHWGYFTHDKVFDKLDAALAETKDFLFLSYPYEGGGEVHGFERTALARYCKTDYVKYVCRGGFFGGKKEEINQINGLYYSYLKNSLSEGLMGTEESIFTILMHNHGDIISQFMIEGNGLVWPFFEELKSGSIVKKIVNKYENNLNIKKVGLYVITFNSPNQFRTLIKSMLEYDEDFLNSTTKFLLDNSSDLTTTEEYISICKEHRFEHIKKDNLGICGGRQFIAEHFNETDLDYYLFFEDDMFFYPNKGDVCKNGFNRKVDNLYQKSLEIIKKENFDFLKFNYTEFYGDNGTQWSWYNVPQVVRQEFFPEKTQLPKMGLDPDAPRTEFKNIRSVDGLSYVSGDIYYSNWPQIVSKDGNKKCFIDTRFASPYEQTIMSFIFQETKKGVIKPGLLLLTPTEHNRFDHYDASLRKEC